MRAGKNGEQGIAVEVLPNLLVAAQEIIARHGRGNVFEGEGCVRFAGQVLVVEYPLKVQREWRRKCWRL